MDGRTQVCTYARMDGHWRPALLGRLCQSFYLKIRLFGSFTHQQSYLMHGWTMLGVGPARELYSALPDSVGFINFAGGLKYGVLGRKFPVGSRSN